MRRALGLLLLSLAPLACGFPDYGGFLEGTGGASTSSASGSGGLDPATGSGGSGGDAGAGGATGGSGGEGGGPECLTNADCSGSFKGPVCDLSTETCVECLFADDPCGLGLVCAPDKTCIPGCTTDADCNLGGSGSGGGGNGGGGGGGGAPPAALTCDVATNTCLGCATDAACPPGTVCDVEAAACVPGCNPDHDCHTNHTCCSGACANLAKSIDHCGACESPCDPDNATGDCAAGVCKVKSCDPGANDCDLDPLNGCESLAATDPANCSACGTSCDPLASALPGCSGGKCALGECIPGFGNCDGDATNGCETNLTTSPMNCGECGKICVTPNGTGTCQLGKCQIAACESGYADCDLLASTGCEVNTNADPANCGACDKLCAPENGAGICDVGICKLSACAPPFADCNLQLADGCETNLSSTLNHCGTCGKVCSLPNATATCANGACAIGSCNSGYGDCDGNPANGCEVNLLTTVANCGQCGSACSANNGTPSCASGTCAIACSAGFANCDGNLTNGCEVNTSSNVNHCSVCNNKCSAAGGTPACNNSVCTVSSCQPGLADCDGNPANGCEVTTTSNPDHCGSCGNKCFVANGTPGCNASQCFVSSCSSGFANCNNQYADGCEVNTNASVTNCGGCGVVCTNPNGTTSCQGGGCSPACSGGYGDCDGSKVNGCETNILSTLAHCGGCAQPCSHANGSSACNTGSCTLTGCNANWANCDGNAANGCETSLITTSNCGACGVACTNAHGSTSCTASACNPSCSSGWGDCNANKNDGCETSLTTISNCGTCGTTCSRPNASASCGTGTCQLGICNANFGNCDGNATNGCEANLLSNSSHCGGCNIACGAGQVCSSGSCVSNCPAGYADCDGNLGNGCEAHLASDPLNCGACGVKCGSDGTCACNGGACSGGTVYFSDSFATNKGWSFGPEWQVGPALQSGASDYGWPDPAVDHTPTADNRVAGVVLGGNASTFPHGYYYLTSPIINLSSAVAVNLTFWRWLNSDYAPYMVNRVEVYNGSGWVVLWQTGDFPGITDDLWTRVEHSVTAQKNANFRVRFGFLVDNSLGPVYSVSQWNLDDVTLSSGTCN